MFESELERHFFKSVVVGYTPTARRPRRRDARRLPHAARAVAARDRRPRGRARRAAGARTDGVLRRVG